MKNKIILGFILLTIMSLGNKNIEKTGISKFDNLKYSKGKTIYFYDYDSEIIEESKTKNENSDIERKIFKQGNKYIVADYYISTNRPSLIFETEVNPEKYSELLVSGDRVSYYENGKLKSIGKYKKGVEIGKHIYYKENGEESINIH